MPQPAIICRRVDVFAAANEFFLSIIDTLLISWFLPSSHNNMETKYDQDHILGKRNTVGDTSPARTEEDSCPTPPATARK
jgi:hypothetical protein